MRWLRFHSSREHRAFAPGWIGRLALSNFLAGTLGTLAALAGVATYVVLTKKSALLGAQPETVSTLVALDIILLCMLALVVVRRVVVLLRARAQGRAGARLHLKLVIMFSLLAVMPAVLAAGLSANFFFAGVQTWFSSSVSGAVRESTQVAASALEAHQRTILADAFAVANLPHELPVQFQFAPVYALTLVDANLDGHLDVVAAGNQSSIRIRLGVMDANFGQLFLNDGHGRFTYVPQPKSGLNITGDTKSLEMLKIGNQHYLVAGINNIGVHMYRLNP